MSIFARTHWRRAGPAPRIAIVGRGFTGAAAAVALLRRHEAPFSLVLIDESSSMGAGVAYGKAREGELLNVRARDLSLLADEPGDFARWLLEYLNTGGTAARRVLDVGQIFAPRALFADYVRERLQTEILRRRDVTVQLVTGRAIGLTQRPGGYAVLFDEGESVNCDAVLLAIGYGGEKKSFRFGADPFGARSEDAIRAAKRVVLVGSGLTMVDVLLRLRRTGSAARITIISRNGLAPLPQLKQSPVPEEWRGIPTHLAGELLSEVKRACREAAKFGKPWQAVVNGVRPEAQSLWRALPISEQRRFLRHARPFWNIHRHRLPADVYLQLRQELERDRTDLAAGNVMPVDQSPAKRIAVRWRDRTDWESLDADFVIDCSGHKPDLSSSLLRCAIREDLARIDAHGIGLEVDPAGRTVGAGGAFSDTLFALGPLGAGSLLEITAAPEIAEQASAMAAIVNARSKAKALSAGSAARA